MKTRNIFNETVKTMAAGALMVVIFAASSRAQDNRDEPGANGRNRSGKGGQVVLFSQTSQSYAADIEARKLMYRRFDVVDITEAPMRLESWMVDRRYFVYRLPAEKESDSPLTSELDASPCSVVDMAAMLVPECDSPLKLEAWMTNADNFPCAVKGHTRKSDLNGMAHK